MGRMTFGGVGIKGWGATGCGRLW